MEKRQFFQDNGPFPQINYFDLENPLDQQRLENPLLTLTELTGLIVIDEIQLRPELFPVLRVIIDQHRTTQRYLILGSASRDLIHQSSETLAGRISYLELTPFALTEAQKDRELWIRGGFPQSFLATTEHTSFQWREAYIQTFIERDIPALGIQIPSMQLRRFWLMLAQYHGNVMNASELGRSLNISYNTVKRYLDILSGTFMIRQLHPWFENLGKRQVKAPKIYFRDSGIFHALAHIDTYQNLLTNPKLGASWEGFALEEVIRMETQTGGQPYFWKTHSGAELDLLIMRGDARIGFDFKYSENPKTTKSMHAAIQDLSLHMLWVISPGLHDFPLAPNIRAVGLSTYVENFAMRATN